MNPQPPKWAIKLLRFYCKPSKLEAIEGDLHELFKVRLEEKNNKSAQRMFIWDVFRFFRWRYIKGLEDIKSLTTIAMFRNYFKVSIRSLLRHKFYSVVNVLGLSIGIACCLYILMFVNHELSYDNFWNGADRIHRVVLNKKGSNTPARLVKQMREDYPEVEQGARIMGPFGSSFKIENKTFKQEGGFIADSTFFEVFNIKFLYGNPASALSEPNTVVISRDLANKYFPEQEALGKILLVDTDPTKITGIIENPSKNSHIQYKFIAAIPRQDWATKGWWTGNNFYSYLKLKKGADPTALEAKFPDFVRKYVGPEIIKFSGHESFDDFLAEGRNFNYNLVPIQDIHLHHANLSLGVPGKISNVYVFSVVAFFILLIACINFMNLSTARSTTRSKEVGIRKVLGSLKGQLVSQFLVESILVCSVSLVVGLLIVIIALPQFNPISGKAFQISEVLNQNNIIWLGVIGIITGVLAGSYPAIYFSRVKPILALKGIMKSKKGGELLRKGLVSFQFGISILLIISTLIVYSQISFMSSKDLGLNSKQTLIIKNARKLKKNSAYFQDFLNSTSEINSISLTSSYPSGRFSDWNYNTVEDIPLQLGPYNVFVGENFLDVLDVELVQGRFFNPLIASDTSAVVVNQAFLNNTNWEEGVGRQLTRGEESRFTIIGVVRDFHFHSVKRKIAPLLMRYNMNKSRNFGGMNFLMVNINGNYKEVLNKIEKEWQNQVPDHPFEYVFLDNSFNSLYESERKFGELFTLFSLLAIFIGSLGMLALAAFVIERRIKEIAIRKVLGASVVQITSLLLKDFTKLVILGGVLALPIAYFLGQEWLSNFQYQMDLDMYLFWLPIVFVIIISWLTVGYQSLVTAKSNPATILQNE